MNNGKNKNKLPWGHVWFEEIGGEEKSGIEEKGEERRGGE